MTATGRMAPDLTPYIRVDLAESGGQHEMVVDTRFNDHLYLPEDLILAWGLMFLIVSTMKLADGAILAADLYEANIVWFGKKRRVTVLAGPVGCDSILGMRLLAGHRIELDELNAEVRIELL